MAGTAATVSKTGFPGIEIHGRSIRVAFMYKGVMYKGVRHRHTLGMEPTKNNIKHAAGLRSAALFALKTGAYNEADFFPHSRPSDSGATGKRVGDPCERFTKSNKEPDPLSHEEFQALIDKGCIYPTDRAAVTLAVYTGLRPGELLALAVEDVAADLSKITVRRSITQSVTFKVPKTQARRKVVNDYFVPSAWNTKWANLVRRAKIRPRPPYQTRHTYACWNLTAQGNLAFIANQMGHKDFSMLVNVYARWIDTESPRELDRIWEGMQNMATNDPNLPQRFAA